MNRKYFVWYEFDVKQTHLYSKFHEYLCEKNNSLLISDTYIIGHTNL